MSRLEFVEDWLVRALSCGYNANQLARLCDISPGHLRRLFSEHFGKSPQEWLNELRLWKATELVCNRVPLKQIAADLNFASTTHFCHAFKAYHTCSPSEFRKLYFERLQMFEDNCIELGVQAIKSLPPWEIAARSLCGQIVISVRTRRMHALGNKRHA